MELQDYLRVMRRRWKLILSTTLAVLLVAGLITYFTPKQYQSTARVFVSTTGTSSTADLAAGSTFTQRQVKTYADLIRTPAVLQPVIDELKLQESAADLSERVSSTVPVDTVLIQIAVTDPDPAQSDRIATAVADQFRSVVPELETVTEGDASPVKVTVVESPAEGVQVKPQPVRNVGLGLVLGLLLGLGLALLREMLDTSIKSTRDVQEVTDTTIIGGITFDKDASAHPLIVQADPHSPRAEAFRAVRTNLQFIDVSHPPRAFVITSSLPGEGKSTTAANMALTIAAGGPTVCVIEGDLRRSRLLAYMGLESGVGLTNVLIGEADLDDVLQPFADTNVTVLGAGPVPPNPSELLGSERMREVLGELREKFDYVLIDTPPLLPVTDAAVVSKAVDGAVVIVGAGVIDREHLAHSLEILETVGARTLGIVMNRLPLKKGNSGYYGYGYYGDYSDNKGSASNAAKKVSGGTGATAADRTEREAPAADVPGAAAPDVTAGQAKSSWWRRSRRTEDAAAAKAQGESADRASSYIVYTATSNDQKK